MKVLTIDFDIIMHPSIDLYNDSDLDVDEFLLKFESTLGWMAADLELYRRLTNFILSFDKDKINFIYNHDDIVTDLEENLTVPEKVDLYNIDYHHDVGYGEINWRSPLRRDYDEGNWIKYLWDNAYLSSYTWIKDYESADIDIHGRKYITSKYFINAYDLDQLKNADKVYICLSAAWVPEYYTHLYDLWKDLTNKE